MSTLSAAENDSKKSQGNVNDEVYKITKAVKGTLT